MGPDISAQGWTLGSIWKGFGRLATCWSYQYSKCRCAVMSTIKSGASKENKKSASSGSSEKAVTGTTNLFRGYDSFRTCKFIKLGSWGRLRERTTFSVPKDGAAFWHAGHWCCAMRYLTWLGHVSLGIVDGRVRHFSILRQFYDILVCIHSFDLVYKKSAGSWVTFKVTIVSVSNGSVGIIDWLSLVGMIVETFKHLAASLWGCLPTGPYNQICL